MKDNLAFSVATQAAKKSLQDSSDNFNKKLSKYKTEIEILNAFKMKTVAEFKMTKKEEKKRKSKQKKADEASKAAVENVDVEVVNMVLPSIPVQNLFGPLENLFPEEEFDIENQIKDCEESSADEIDFISLTPSSKIAELKSIYPTLEFYCKLCDHNFDTERNLIIHKSSLEHEELSRRVNTQFLLEIGQSCNCEVSEDKINFCENDDHIDIFETIWSNRLSGSMPMS